MTEQFGVSFHDGSVKHPWNGRTQEQRAREDLERLRELFPNDSLTLVWRASPADQWRPWEPDDVGYSGIAMAALRAGGFGANAEAYRASGLADD